MIIKDYIFKLLSEKEHLRDNDNALLCNIWFKQLKSMGLDPMELPTFKFMELLRDGKLINPESSRRQRQKIQEENIHLRGKNYDKRQKNEKRVRKSVASWLPFKDDI